MTFRYFAHPDGLQVSPGGAILPTRFPLLLTPGLEIDAFEALAMIDRPDSA